jgi:2,5-furandicarboxylate decarboxylase 1
MEQAGLVTKAGYDATAKSGDRAEGIERALPPTAASRAAIDWLRANLPPERRRWLKS